MKRQLSAALGLLVWTLGATALAGYLALVLSEVVYQVSLGGECFRFARPEGAWLLLAVPLVVTAQVLLAHAQPRIRVSRGKALAALPRGWRRFFRAAPAGLRAAALALLVAVLMGPQSIHARNTTELSGIDIVLALDMSLSMEAADIAPNRFVATQQVVGDFISRRPNDRIGAVVFGRDAYSLLPLTTDRHALATVIQDLELEQIDGRGTAIGNAIGTSLNRLRSSDATSKVIILLTDGDSNAGNVSPEQAAELAHTMGVKVYTILMGASSDARVQRGTDLFGRPIFNGQNMPVNPELLRRIAERSGGEHFDVSDRQGLERSFHRILDTLERSDIEDAGETYGELYPVFLGPALALLLLEFLLGLFVVRRWP